MIWVKVKAEELVRLQRQLEEMAWAPGHMAGLADDMKVRIDGWLADPARQLAPEPQRISVRFAAVSVGGSFDHNGVAYRKTSTVTATPTENPLPPIRFKAGDAVEIDRVSRSTGEGGRK